MSESTWLFTSSQEMQGLNSDNQGITWSYFLDIIPDNAPGDIIVITSFRIVQACLLSSFSFDEVSLVKENYLGII